MTRKTKIICTIGPKTESKKMLKKLADAGMNIARINCAHGNYEWYRKIVKNIKELNKKLEFPVAIMFDIKGPEIRTAPLNEDLFLQKGDRIEIKYGKICNLKEKSICVNYPHIFKDVKKNDLIKLESGMIEAKIIKKSKKKLICRILNKGKINHGRRHVNLPGVDIDLPSLTVKDKRDLDFAAKMDADFIALSFVREKKDILALKKILKQEKLSAEIIAKIEDQEAVDNLDSIIEASDAVMVARGDLGIEVPFEEIPLLQKKIAEKCRQLGKPVIIATHLLESMVANPIPTRAELTDVANAITEEVDAIMLSEETTIGAYPVRAVEIQDKIARRMEKEQIHIIYPKKRKKLNQQISNAAVFLSNNINVKAVIVITYHGETAKNVSCFRPDRLIYAFTPLPKTRRKMAVLWGVYSYKINFYSNTEKTVARAIRLLKENKKIKKGDSLIIVSDILSQKNKINAVQIRKVK